MKNWCLLIAYPEDHQFDCCACTESERSECKHHSGSVMYCEYENDLCRCTSDAARKEAAETAVRLGQEYLVNRINEKVKHETEN